MSARNDELAIESVAEAVPLSRTAVSHHLNALRKAGVLQAERRGKEVFLRPDTLAVLEVINAARDYIQDEL